MAIIQKTSQGKWRVVDSYLGVDEEFETATEAFRRKEKCNVEKLTKMSQE